MAKTALCIGINNYPGRGNDLDGCVNDANDWAEELGKRGFTVSKLLDKKATKAAMVKAIGKLVQEAKSGDLVLITYSGHGSYIPDEDGDEPDGTDEVLCPWDIEKNGPLSDDELYGLFSERQRGAKIVFVADSCHSGSVARFAPMHASSSRTHRVRFLPPSTFLSEARVASFGLRTRALRRSASPPGRYGSLLMAACQDSELSYDAEFDARPNGAYTYSALQALKTLPATATYAQWHRAIRGLLPTSEYPQTPNLYGSRSQKAWRIFE